MNNYSITWTSRCSTQIMIGIREPELRLGNWSRIQTNRDVVVTSSSSLGLRLHSRIIGGFTSTPQILKGRASYSLVCQKMSLSIHEDHLARTYSIVQKLLPPTFGRMKWPWARACLTEINLFRTLQDLSLRNPEFQSSKQTTNGPVESEESWWSRFSINSSSTDFNFFLETIEEAACALITLTQIYRSH